jgi:excinuclease UvrABC nuclease subunit
MAFQYGPYAFNNATIDTMSNGYGVYGLSRGSGYLGIQPVAYVGKSVTLRDRLTYWLNNPPGIGLTHFYAEAFGTEAAMTAREEQLIKELQPALNTLLK